ncbi:MAG: pyridoxamine 5'-phosphate oxidase family protein [Deltaproteobacteria bacterium]|nr:pyridoxamine 5'-phosphate oxidase family protein [Deltaproteobacteria bacterium]
MAKIPEIVNQAWANREDRIILTTVDKDGVPNAVYITCVARYGEDLIVIADNYFDKTRKNILSGSKGSVLFITKEGKSYQAKGTIEYSREGEIFDDMKNWNPAKHPGHAAAALKVEEVYAGAEKLFG